MSALGTHAGKLERWLGKEAVDGLVEATRNWYGPPIAVAGVPGNVWAHRGGDIRGPIQAGGFVGVRDAAERRLRQVWKNLRRMSRGNSMYTGFASFSDLIAEATAGKRRTFTMQKVGTTGVVAATNTLWFVGNQPSAGAAAAAAPGGTQWTDASTGAFPFTNPGGGDTQHLVLSNILATIAGNQLLIYDRLHSATKTMNSSANETVSGVPLRYQSTTGGAQDSAEGNFLMIECRTVLPATAHNWDAQYTDQGGATLVALPQVVGNSSNIVNRLDMPVGTWFCPLAAGDTGILALTRMTCSALVASGAIDFTIGHPLAFVPLGLANFLAQVDHVNTSFGLVRIFDDACIAFLEVMKSATNATTYAGSIETVIG